MGSVGSSTGRISSPRSTRGFSGWGWAGDFRFEDLRFQRFGEGNEAGCEGRGAGEAIDWDEMG